MSHIKLNHDAWMLVGDGEKALFLRNEGDAEYPNLQVVRMMTQDNPPTHEQGADRPGRYHDGRNVQRSAVDDTDWHSFAKHQFAKEVAARLYTLAHQDRFKEIVLVAPPKTLGDLRAELHSEVLNRVVAEVDKTLTGHALYDIERILLKD